MKSASLIIGGVIVFVFALIAIFAGVLSSNDPTAIFAESLKLPPFWLPVIIHNFGWEQMMWVAIYFQGLFMELEFQ